VRGFREAPARIKSYEEAKKFFKVPLTQKLILLLLKLHKRHNVLVNEFFDFIEKRKFYAGLKTLLSGILMACVHDKNRHIGNWDEYHLLRHASYRAVI
jgi:hypothetical protein